MSKANTGFIVQLPDGRYKVYLELSPTKEGKRVRKSHICKTKSEAKKKLIEMNQQREQLESQSNPHRFNKAMQEHLRVITDKVTLGTLKEKTLMDYKGIIKKLSGTFLADMDCNDITTKDINTLFTQFSKEGLSGSYLAKTLILLKGIYKAVNVPCDFLKDVDFKYNPRKTAGAKVHPYSKEDTDKLDKYFNSSDNDRLIKYIYYFTLMTGCRIGEVCGFKWSDIKPEEGIIEINRTLMYIVGKGLIEESPKTTDSKRRLVVPKSIFQLLNVDLKHFYETHYYNNKDYVFSTRYGTPLSPRNVLRAWKGVLKATKIDPKHTFHDIRHTNITIKIARGVDVKTVSIMAGHADTSVTLNTYAHYWKEAAQRAANIFDGSYHSSYHLDTKGT